MNDPATPPGSDGPLDRLAELAEGLLQQLEEGGGGLGEILFVMVVLHYLLRFAARYIRLTAGSLAPCRTEAAAGSPAPVLHRIDPYATSRPAPPIRSDREAHGAGRENSGGERAGDRHAGGTQAPDGDAATATARSLPHFSLDPAGYDVPRRAPRGRPYAAGAHLVIRARPRPHNFRRVTGHRLSHAHNVASSKRNGQTLVGNGRYPSPGPSRKGRGE